MLLCICCIWNYCMGLFYICYMCYNGIMLYVLYVIWYYSICVIFRIYVIGGIISLLCYWIIYFLYRGIIFCICVYWLYGLYIVYMCIFVLGYFFWEGVLSFGNVLFFNYICFKKKYEARTDRKNFNKQRVAKNYVGSLQVVGIYEL